METRRVGETAREGERAVARAAPSGSGQRRWLLISSGRGIPARGRIARLRGAAGAGGCAAGPGRQCHNGTEAAFCSIELGLLNGLVAQIGFSSPVQN